MVTATACIAGRAQRCTVGDDFFRAEETAGLLLVNSEVERGTGMRNRWRDQQGRQGEPEPATNLMPRRKHRGYSAAVSELVPPV
jgi:hypothetical protein